MLTAILTLFLLAFLAPMLHRVLGGTIGWVLSLPVLAVTAWFVTLVPAVSGGKVLVESRPWVPRLGIDLAFRIDGWSLVFLLLIGGIGVLILIYSGGYLHGRSDEGRFFGLLLLFMASMLGLAAADNLILMFIFWELTSFSSYLLIGFNHEEKKARAAALQALLITSGGGMALLAGFILIGQAGGTFSFSTLLENADSLRGHPLYLSILFLVLGGAFTKSAQVPFHFWLPGAMVAPTPVSAYLHSATMVQAGVFLLGRFNPLLGGTGAWHTIVAGVGAATMLTGALMALPQTDLKRLLAYSTVSALGTLTMLFGIGTTLAAEAAAVFLIVHSLYKGALFMVAGAVDHETGTRDVRLLSGLFKVMPITALAAGAAALSMSGFPPLLGFIGKELLYEANLAAPGEAVFITAAGIGANVLMVAVAIIVGLCPFHGRVQLPENVAHEPPFALWLGPAVLAALGLVAGLFPSLVDKPFVAAAVSAVQGVKTTVELKLWHGLNLVLALSVATVLAGVIVYRLRDRLRALTERLAPVAHFGPERCYRLGLRALMTLADWQTRLLQHGYLRGYVLTVLGVAVALAAFALVRFGPEPLWIGFGDVRFYEVVVGSIIFAAALVAARANSRISAVAALAVVGYGVALIYCLYGAPDLALTQILVETLTLVLFVLVVVRLPQFSTLSSPWQRRRDAILAGCGGLVITLLVLKALHVDSGPRISVYFVENALRAHGRNVDNVIIVDFRALDTLGEITVLGIAALGVFALFMLRPNSRKEGK